jgi:hypothetical protein
MQSHRCDLSKYLASPASSWDRSRKGNTCHGTSTVAGGTHAVAPIRSRARVSESFPTGAECGSKATGVPPITAGWEETAGLASPSRQVPLLGPQDRGAGGVLVIQEPWRSTRLAGAGCFLRLSRPSGGDAPGKAAPLQRSQRAKPDPPAFSAGRAMWLRRPRRCRRQPPKDGGICAFEQPDRQGEQRQSGRARSCGNVRALWDWLLQGGVLWVAAAKQRAMPRLGSKRTFAQGGIWGDG